MRFTPLPSDMPGPLGAVIYDPANTTTTNRGVAVPASAVDHPPPSTSTSVEDAVMEDLERAVRQDVHEVNLAENKDPSQEQTPPATSELDTDRIRETHQNRKSTRARSQVKQEDPEGSLFVSDEPLYIVIDDSDAGDNNTQQAVELSDDTDMETVVGNDSDYKPEDDPNSDDEESSAQDGKLQPSIPGEEVSQKLEKLKLQKMNLKTKSEYVNLDDKEKQMLLDIEEGLAKLQAPPSQNADADPKKFAPKKKRRKNIKNVREYFVRKHEEEDEKDAEREEKKRKQEVQSGGPKKRRTTAKQHLHGAAERKTIKMRGRIFHGLNDVEEDIAQGSIPTMATFQANTKKDQWRHLKRGIPEGSDLRRVKTQAKDLDEASKMFGFGKIKAIDSVWLLDGMKNGLLDYQLSAVGWMMSRECGRIGPTGGILADAPGLGKTVISLASIIGNPPRGPEDEEFCQATLIGVPNKDIAIQWRDETRKHCKAEYADRVIIWSQSMDIPVALLKSQWIIITTYHAIMSQLPKPKEIAALKEDCGEDQDRFERELNGLSGELLRVNWYRVILDEAHAIKNHEARVTLACWQIRSKYRWALSGTPLSNKLTEIFPYLKFIGCNFTRTLSDFSSTYIRKESNTDNLDTLISMIMMRRTNKDTFMGHRVLLLPNAHSQDIRISLSVGEEMIYEAVHLYYHRIIRALKRKLDSGSGEAQTLMRQIEIVTLARQTRLRQVTSHPFTIEKVFQEKFREDDIVAIRRGLIKKAVVPVIDSLRDGDRKFGLLSKFKIGLHSVEAMEEEAFGGSFNINELMKLAQNEASIRGIRCGICDEANTPVAPLHGLYCAHIFCETCLLRTVTGGRTNGLDTLEEVTCPVDGCRATLGVGDDIQTLVAIQEETKRNENYKEPGRDMNNARLTRKPQENGFFTATALPTGDEIPPSSKLTTTMAVIEQWRHEAPNDKIVGKCHGLKT
ncbi:hypothetical protein ACHAPQ_003652 [Fusarium lateritium]